MPVPPGFEPENRGKCKTCSIDIPKNRYYCDEHRPALMPKKPTAAQKRAKANLDKPAVTKIGAAATDIAKGAGGGKAPSGGAKKAPTVDATAKVMGKVLMYVTILIAMRLVSSDPDLRTDADREAQAQEIQLDEAQAQAMIHPIARFVTPLGFWRAYGGHVIDNADIIDCVASIYDYFSGLARYSASLRRRRLELDSIPVASRPAMPAHMPVQSTNGVVAEPEEIDSREGRVVTGAEVRRMKGLE